MKILSRLTGREKAILYVSLAVILLSLIYNFTIEPLFKKWNAIERDTRLTRVKLQRAISVITDRYKIDKEYNTYAAVLKTRGTDEQEMTHILDELETIARGSNLKIVNMRPKPVKDNDYYSRFVVDIDTESDMRSLMMFIYKVRNSSQLLKIDRLRLNTKSGQDQIIMKASMAISKITID